MKLKRTGFFREMPHGMEQDPSIEDYIGYDYDPISKNNICEYLNAGIVLMACGGTVADVISDENLVAGCPDLLTDGIWVWPGDLVYYVNKYNVQLSSEFEALMKKNDYKIKIELDDINLDELSFC